MTETYGIMTVVTVVSGTLGVGDALSGTGGGGVTAASAITALGTGTGGVGTYTINLTQTVATSNIIANTSTETKYYAMSSGAPGELVKMTSHALG